jgi:hypothetical protein
MTALRSPALEGWGAAAADELSGVVVPSAILLGSKLGSCQVDKYLARTYRSFWSRCQNACPTKLPRNISCYVKLPPSR